MGCGMTKEKIEIEMLYLQLMRNEIRDERRAIIEKLQELTGKKITRISIPDYIDENEKSKEEQKFKRDNQRKQKTPRNNKHKKKVHKKKENNESSSIYEIPSDDNNDNI